MLQQLQQYKGYAALQTTLPSALHSHAIHSYELSLSLCSLLQAQPEISSGASVLDDPARITKHLQFAQSMTIFPTVTIDRRLRLLYVGLPRNAGHHSTAGGRAVRC